MIRDQFADRLCISGMVSWGLGVCEKEKAMLEVLKSMARKAAVSSRDLPNLLCLRH